MLRPLMSVVFLMCVTGLAQDLLPGHIEARALGGMNYDLTNYDSLDRFFPGVDLRAALKTGRIHPTYAFEAAVGLTRWAALVGSYTHNQRSDAKLPNCEGTLCDVSRADHRRHEFMGGFRASLPTQTRFAPYAQISVGAIRESWDTLVLLPSIPPLPPKAVTRFAVEPGVGVNVMLTRHLGVTLDVRGVKALDFDWAFRTTGGVLWRF